MEYSTCLEKQGKIKKLFDPLETSEEKYQKIISLGQELSKLDQEHQTPENLVDRCQSKLYLHSYFEHGKVYFQVSMVSDLLPALTPRDIVSVWPVR